MGAVPLAIANAALVGNLVGSPGLGPDVGGDEVADAFDVFEGSAGSGDLVADLAGETVDGALECAQGLDAAAGDLGARCCRRAACG
ncbi:MAG: hypothetical protein OXB99_14590 [Acidimicrobiaceae bacterium]|nr:hypothetical protein [Acidimicrobiaceae bacterium]